MKHVLEFMKVSFCAVFLFSCAPDPLDKETNRQQTLGLGGDIQPDDYYCPDGYHFDNRYHVCEGQLGVLGPFSPGMVEKCHSFGGGAPCDGLHWQTEFAHGLRGTGQCPSGTQWDSSLETCFSGDHVYGPFLRSQRDLCVSAGGGPACETMRWSRGFYTSIQSRVSGRPSSVKNDGFVFPRPDNEQIIEQLQLWATYYMIPTAEDKGKAGIPLLDLQGNNLGVSLSNRDWCHAALEGTVRVLNSLGGAKIFNYAGTRENSKQADCSKYFSLSGVSYSRFYPAKGEFGDGIGGYHLKPFRTIAVDPGYIPYGSLVYIPDARDTPIVLPNGSQVLHDGYFFAGDTGGAIHGNQIDVFIGIAVDNPFSFVRSRRSDTFKAYLIGSSHAKEKLHQTHTQR